MGDAIRRRIESGMVSKLFMVHGDMAGSAHVGKRHCSGETQCIPPRGETEDPSVLPRDYYRPDGPGDSSGSSGAVAPNLHTVMRNDFHGCANARRFDQNQAPKTVEYGVGPWRASPTSSGNGHWQHQGRMVSYPDNLNSLGAVICPDSPLRHAIWRLWRMSLRRCGPLYIDPSPCVGTYQACRSDRRNLGEYTR